MSQIRLPALAGDSPLAILAAVGTLRLINDYVAVARLSWDSRDWVPLLDSPLTTVDDVAASLAKIVEKMPARVLVPGGPTGYPPPDKASDKMRVPRGELVRLVADATSGRSDSEVASVHAWTASLVTDLAVDQKKRVAVSQFVASSGRQTITTMLNKPLESVQKDPDLLRQALVGWRRVSGVTGENLDHRAIWSSSDDGEGKSRMRGVPGATWLALMSYPLWTTTAIRGEPRTSGWHTTDQGGSRGQELRLPLWGEPIGPIAVKALVEHPALDGDWDDLNREALQALGVFHVCRARWHKAVEKKPAVVLVPL